MNQNLKQGINRILEDNELSKKFSEAKTLREKYEIASPYLNNVSFEEFEREMHTGVQSLSVDELEEVAGGKDLPKNVKNYLNKISSVAGMIANFLPDVFPGVNSNTVGRAIRKAVVQATNTLAFAESIEEVVEAVVEGTLQGLKTGKIITKDQKEKFANVIKTLVGSGLF